MNLSQFNREIAEIRGDRVHGASELARRCLTILAEAAKILPATDGVEFRQYLLALAAELAMTRPSMAPVGHLLRRWRAEMSVADGDLDLDWLRRFAVERATALVALSRQAVSDCAVHAAHWLGPGRTLMTHSLSSTVLETCRLLKDQGLQMIVTESRPLIEGRRVVERLSTWNVPTTYITDAQMGVFVGQADGVLVGADSLLSDGSVVNKAGTVLLALAAREYGVPFYVCCESFKQRAAGEAPPVLEEMASSELEVPAWPGVSVRNIYFDITPARLINAWISETGVRRAVALS
ncbi:MAG: translation initiation factor eIF-2B [Phycisphaerales bacterium]|nr:translation initiation factor eIF-2B [Phycisphaerales bacterium]